MSQPIGSFSPLSDQLFKAGVRKTSVAGTEGSSYSPLGDHLHGAANERTPSLAEKKYPKKVAHAFASRCKDALQNAFRRVKVSPKLQSAYLDEVHTELESVGRSVKFIRESRVESDSDLKKLTEKQEKLTQLSSPDGMRQNGAQALDKIAQARKELTTDYHRVVESANLRDAYAAEVHGIVNKLRNELDSPIIHAEAKRGELTESADLRGPAGRAWNKRHDALRAKVRTLQMLLHDANTIKVQ